MSMVMTKQNGARRLNGLRRANFRTIEAELYNYHHSRQLLAEYLKELDVIADSTVVTMPADEDRVQSSNYLSDIVATRAGELAAMKEYTVAVLLETARRLDAIDYMLRRLKVDPEPRKLEAIQKRYFENRFTDEGIQMELGVSERTLRRWRREAIEIVAARLGIIV